MAATTSPWKLFFKEWLRAPLRVASVKPSSQALARCMANEISSPNGLVLELGPGTGPLTQGILDYGIAPNRLFLVEKSENMHQFLQHKFPNLTVICGDATDVTNLLPQHTIGEFTDTVSGIPLLSMRREMRRAIVQSAFAVMKPGGRFIQFSFGLIPPFGPEHLNLKVYLAGRVWDNLPPATVWVYEQK